MQPHVVAGLEVVHGLLVSMGVIPKHRNVWRGVNHYFSQVTGRFCLQFTWGGRLREGEIHQLGLGV